MTDKAEKTEYRRGPTPIPVHVGLALAEYMKLQEDGNATPEDLQKMMAGIQKYQKHPYRRHAASLPVVWQEGEVSLLYCAAEKAVASLLLVPSLVNKSYILDLLPDKSFVRWLAAQGIDCYLMDWGVPVADEGLHDIDRLVTQRLCPAIRAVAQRAGGPAHALGYCMGGTLLAAAAMHVPEELRSIIFLASPWDFAAGDRNLAGQVTMGSATALQMIEKEGFLPMDWVQSVFATVNAGRAMNKFAEFTALDDDSEAARLFVAVEDWLNEGVDMPGPMARTCILDWYGRNKPGQDVWEAGGRAIDLAALDVPALVVASLNDRLVPKESSLSMAKLLRRAKVLEPSSGHIGMMTGRRAQDQVWQPVATWVLESAKMA